MVQAAGSYGWVVAFVCILVLLGAGLIAFVVIKRSRGGMYPGQLHITMFMSVYSQRCLLFSKRSRSIIIKNALKYMLTVRK